ncbi:MAG: serine/threonine-protein kinase [Gemmatimonadaceae bacterium]|nr:serine/threonine-protein kinase [Gemmatimonadaceae bacterium]
MSTGPEALRAALADRYVIVRELGAGGMATVYLARDVRHAREVAVKVLHPELAAVLGAERFLSEIRTTASLQHPHILPLFDSGEAAGQLFYVMPFVDGETLRSRLEREQQLPIPDALRIAREVADALQYAHDRGVIHRDIKPENILLQGSHALVADFGIALAVTNAGGGRMTQTGLSLGTPQYMSPEQATGERTIDARADVYALAAVTYEMLVGEPPFTGPNTQAIVARLLTTAPASLIATRNTIPAHIDAAVLGALAKLPADRPASAAEFAGQISGTSPVTLALTGEAGLQGGGARGATTDDPRRLTRALQRTRVALWLTAATAIASLSALAWLAQRPAPASPARTFVMALPDSLALLDAPVGRRVALSRDGQRVYFVGGTPSNYGLFVRELADTLVRRLPGGERGGGPVTCPDGKWLYFTRVNLGVWRMPPDGGQPTLVADSATVTDCDADGALLMLRGPRLLLWREGRPLQLVAAPDSSRGESAVGSGTFLPGGTHVVFSVRRIGEPITRSILGTAPRTGGAITSLGVVGLRARWSNGQLLYVRNGDLVAAPFDAAQRVLSSAAQTVARNVATRLTGSDFDVSDDGTLVYGSGNFGSRFHLVRVDRAGREALLDREPGLYSWPRVSPDGKRIAVEVQAMDNAGYDVWLFTLASQSLERLTRGYSGVRPVGWSADGRRVAYLTVRKPGPTVATRTLAWIPADLSGAPEEIPLRAPGGAALEDATLRGTTNLIAFRTGGYGAPGDLWIAAPAPGDSGRVVRPFAATDADEETPRLSPDGRWVAYASNETGQFEVYARAADGTGGRISISAGPGAEPVWTADGRGLYYRGDGRMYFAAFANGTTLQVARRDSLFADVYRRETLAVSYDVFPDGQTLLMQKPGGLSGRSPIVVLNWPALLKAGPEKR